LTKLALIHHSGEQLIWTLRVVVTA